MEISAKYDIEKYDAKTSFALWQVRMTAILSSIGIKDAIHGRDKLVEPITDKKWFDLDDKALSIIQMCLSNSTLQEVLSDNTAKDLWEKLESKYMKKSLTNRLRLKLRLYTLRMVEGTPISDHISEFASLVNDLSKLDAKVEDEDQVLLLLCSLPTSYKAFRHMMIYSRDYICLEDVKSNLQAKLHIDNEMINMEKGGQSVGLVVDRDRSYDKNPKHSRARSKSRHKNLTCNYCRKKGHIKADYFKLKNKQKADKGALSEEVNVVKSDMVDTLCVVDINIDDKNCWVMDTGASQHMTPNRDWFESYEPMEGKVLIGNSNLCKIAGIGSVKIKFHDDKI
jgi:gag-polypeptide of LTR copia-type